MNTPELDAAPTTPCTASEFVLASTRILAVILIGPFLGGLSAGLGALLIGGTIGPIGALLDGQTANIVGYTFAITVYLFAIAVLEGLPAGFIGAIGIVALPWRESPSRLYAPAVFSAGTVGMITCAIRIADLDMSWSSLLACLLVVGNAAVGALWTATPLGKRLANWAQPLRN